MSYLARPDAVERRLQPDAALPGVRSIIVVALNYMNGDDGPVDQPGRPVIARYARGEDYHRVFEEKLEQLAETVRALSGDGTATRCYVDYGPVMERDHAQSAGLGWIGKNTMLLNTALGSFFFLGEILTDAQLAPDPAFQPDHCGSCERCIWACPTGAIAGPRAVDARLCISYLTIELRGPIPVELRPLIGNRVFGCDICQDVCPWNKDAPQTGEPRFQPRPESTGPQLIELMSLSEETFAERYRDTPIARARRRGFLRNVAVALGNWGDVAAVPALRRALDDSDPLIRGHAAWALGRTGSGPARRALERRLADEDDGWVRTEIEMALSAESAQ
jgi:epoxyqueuosine reductase